VTGTGGDLDIDVDDAITIDTTTGNITLTAGGSGDIVFSVDAGSLFTLDSSVANADNLVVSPNNEGTGATFTGTLTSANLTADRTWTFPDDTGNVCLSSGNCAGTTTYWETDGANSLSPGNAAADTDRVVLGGSDSTVHQFEVNGAQTGKALVVFDEDGDQNILVASASGGFRFAVQNDGDLELRNQAIISNASDGTLSLTEPTIQLVGSTAIDVDSPSVNLATQAVDFEIIDSQASALTISQGSNNYLAIDTSSEIVSLGNATTNTAINLIGGTSEIDLTTTGAVDINSGAGTWDATSLSLDGTLASNFTVTGSGQSRLWSIINSFCSRWWCPRTHPFISRNRYSCNQYRCDGHRRRPGH